MALRISTNMASINAQNYLSRSQRGIDQSYAQLASGSRINKASDDAAGLSISEAFRGQIRGYHAAKRNAQDGLSMTQVAEGGLNEISNILIRLRELGVQASSDTVSDRERGFINTEVKNLIQESDRIAKATRFGQTQLLDGTSGVFEFQVDINNDDFVDRIAFDAGAQNATAASLGIDSFDYSSKDGARGALTMVEDAQVRVNTARASLGAIQNRLVSTDENLGVFIENLSAANSRLRDADIASASADLARNNILMNASVATLSQANMQPALANKLIG